MIEIHDNAPGCNSEAEVDTACKVASINEVLLSGTLLIYPNPMSTSTTIEYELTHPQTVTINFYNQFGKQVDRIEQKQSAGQQQVIWAPELPVGIYYFRLKAGDQVASGKMVLMR